MSKTLLLADDSVTIQKVVGISFANENIELVTVDNGDDAIARARELRPDIVLADVVMPGKDGYEVCAALRSDPALRSIPVLLLTGTFEAFDEARAREAGADGHITKPFEAQALVAKVKSLLAAGPAAAAPPAGQPAQTPAPGDTDASFDFFEVDASTPEEPPTPAEPPTAAGEDTAEAVAFEMDDGESGLDFATVVDEPASSGAATPTPEPPAGAAEHTVAFAAPPADDSWPSSDEFDAGLGDSGPDLGSPDLVAPEEVTPTERAAAQQALGVAPPPPPASPPSSEVSPTTATTVLSDDGLDFEFDATSAAAAQAQASEDPLAELEPSSGSREAVLDPDSADSYDVSSSDLADSLPTAPSTPAPGPAPAEAPAAAPGPRPTPDLSPVARERIHEALEKIAWESFADVSEVLVRQVVERVEAIAWEVIPQMAEALIREEIRRMKGEPEDS